MNDDKKWKDIFHIAGMISKGKEEWDFTFDFYVCAHTVTHFHTGAVCACVGHKATAEQTTICTSTTQQNIYS